jgi:predicted DNA-binding protein (UPF0251 family)
LNFGRIFNGFETNMTTITITTIENTTATQVAQATQSTNSAQAAEPVGQIKVSYTAEQQADMRIWTEHLRTGNQQETARRVKCSQSIVSRALARVRERIAEGKIILLFDEIEG